MKEYKKPLAEVFELRVTENIAAVGGKAAGVKLKWQSKIPVSLYTALAHVTSEPSAAAQVASNG